MKKPVISIMFIVVLIVSIFSTSILVSAACSPSPHAQEGADHIEIRMCDNKLQLWLNPAFDQQNIGLQLGAVGFSWNEATGDLNLQTTVKTEGQARTISGQTYPYYVVYIGNEKIGAVAGRAMNYRPDAGNNRLVPFANSLYRLEQLAKQQQASGFSITESLVIDDFGQIRTGNISTPSDKIVYMGSIIDNLYDRPESYQVRDTLITAKGPRRAELEFYNKGLYIRETKNGIKKYTASDTILSYDRERVNIKKGGLFDEKGNYINKVSIDFTNPDKIRYCYNEKSCIEEDTGPQSRGLILALAPGLSSYNIDFHKISIGKSPKGAEFSILTPANIQEAKNMIV